MTTNLITITRRTVLGSGLALVGSARASVPADRRLTFTVLRNGTKVGVHRMVFSGDAASPLVVTDVDMAVKLGPVPMFRYRHHAVERWSAGRFDSLETNSNTNGKLERVSAKRTDRGLSLETANGPVKMPANALPFTHWNAKVFGSPLFNPQEGKLLKVSAARRADGSSTLWSIRGETEIDDWYDQVGVWSALKGTLKDGSRMEYRKI